MELTALGYVGISTADLDGWRTFGTDLFGMQVGDTSSRTLALRVDDRAQRLLLQDGLSEPRFFGWEVADSAGLDALADRLDRAGVANESMNDTDRALRGVHAAVVFRDPAGNRVEVFHGADGGYDFTPGREVSGFRTGTQGLGHAVLTTPEPDALISFYQDVLGFRLSDYQLNPFKAFFFHLNPRHHSLAIIDYPHVGVHHLMVEMLNLDDVGQAYDLALAEGEERIGVTLGRHSNDNMLSFYARTPSGFLLECGWGGRSLDVANWVPEELTMGPSLWGHERYWLPPEGRAAAQAMRIQAARDGYRAPVHVYGDNYDLEPNCRLWQHLDG